MNVVLLILLIVIGAFVLLLNLCLGVVLWQTLRRPLLDDGFTFLGWPFRDLRSQ